MQDIKNNKQKNIFFVVFKYVQFEALILIKNVGEMIN